MAQVPFTVGMAGTPEPYLWSEAKGPCSDIRTLIYSAYKDVGKLMEQLGYVQEFFREGCSLCIEIGGRKFSFAPDNTASASYILSLAEIRDELKRIHGMLPFDERELAKIEPTIRQMLSWVYRETREHV